MLLWPLAILMYPPSPHEVPQLQKKEDKSEFVILACVLVPVFDNPVVHIITAIAHSQHTMVQLVSTAFLIIIHSTGIELKLVARSIYGHTVYVREREFCVV